MGAPGPEPATLPDAVTDTLGTVRPEGVPAALPVTLAVGLPVAVTGGSALLEPVPDEGAGDVAAGDTDADAAAAVPVMEDDPLSAPEPLGVALAAGEGELTAAGLPLVVAVAASVPELVLVSLEPTTADPVGVAVGVCVAGGA